MFKSCLFYVFLMFAFATRIYAGEAQLHALTSIKPLQLIAIAIVGDPQKVDVLLAPQMSPHDYQLRPSDRIKLERADVIFWIGPSMEVFLTPVLSSLPKRIKIISLQTAETEAGDPHLWMDPLLAAAIGHKMADVLGTLAPTQNRMLQENATRLEKKLLAEDKRLRAQFNMLKNPRGYIVAHDAYSRFEARYDLTHVAAVTGSADLPPSAQHIAQIDALLKTEKAECIMREPYGIPRVLKPLLKDNLLKDKKLRVVTIDAMAVDISPTENGTVDFYRALGASMLECIQP
jgi:zinc transport system substrate-binding protein